MARNKYPEETRHLIISVAAQLFIERGYDHTSIQDIIDHLGGLTKGAIYHHFKSKEEIMIAVVDELYSGSDAEMEKVCRQEGLNGREKLKELFRVSLFSMPQKDMFTMFSTATDMMKNPQFLVQYLRDTVQKEVPAVIKKILDMGIEDGSIQTEYPKELSEVVILLGNVWLNPMIYHYEPSELPGRMRFYQYMLKQFGLDIVEDSWIEQMQMYMEIYNGKKDKVEKSE